MPPSEPRKTKATYRRPRRKGCMPMSLFSGILFGVVIASIAWIGGRLGVVNLYTDSLGQAYEAFGKGDLDRAIALAQNEWEADGSPLHPGQTQRMDALTLLVRALIYRSYADYDLASDQRRALELTQKAISWLPYHPEVMAVHAFALQANGQAVEAARFGEAALNKNPQNTLARLAVGLAYGRVGSHHNALQHNQAASQANDQFRLDAWRALAISQGDTGQYEAALNTVQKAIKDNDRLLVLYFEQALYAMQMGNAGGATASYFRVLALDPENVKARLRLCELSILLRETEPALNYCMDVTQRAPRWADGWYQLGREYFLQGKFVEARQSLNQCTTLLLSQNVPIPQRRFECWYLQGQAAELLGDCENLMRVYGEFKLMAEMADLPQTWTYPPEGPAICQAQPP